MPTTLTPCPIPGAELRRLTPADAGQVTVLQRGCWVEEAITNGTMDIPPLTETLEEVAAWLGTTDALGLWLDGRLIGLIRGASAGSTWEIGRIGVVPDMRGHHLGWWLMDQIEARADRACTGTSCSRAPRARATSACTSGAAMSGCLERAPGWSTWRSRSGAD